MNAGFKLDIDLSASVTVQSDVILLIVLKIEDDCRVMGIRLYHRLTIFATCNLTASAK